MAALLQAAALAVLGCILVAVLKRKNPDLAMTLSIACCVGIGVLLLRTAYPVLEFVKRLQRYAGLSDAVMRPMWKTAGICFLTQISATFCADAGDTAIAKMVELCGSLAALYLALPLLTAVFEMIQKMAGG